EIGQLVFSRCCFTSITIPKSVTHIGLWAFDACNDLTQVNITDLTAWCNIDFEGSNSNPLAKANNLFVNGNKVTNLVIPNSVTTINNYAFNGCSMNSVTIPSTVTSIGDNAFRNCSQLSSVLIPNSVTSIGSYAFSGCTCMTSVTIPNSITQIEGIAFSNCSSLSSVVTKIETPENVHYANASSQFNGIPEASTLYVPVGTIDKYQLDKYNGKTNPWLAFGEVCEVVDGDVNLDGAVTSTDVTVLYNYLLNGDTGHIATSDIDGDGTITAADITAIYNMLLGQ
ncbi:MAG: leucine-rich repeat protein, partial [Muribaculaceae bacterium]|nr:leucine-rich repeat protein [Muribaculaceae bacterium]